VLPDGIIGAALFYGATCARQGGSYDSECVVGNPTVLLLVVCCVVGLTVVVVVVGARFQAVAYRLG
jgi:hypothetical protein